MIHICELMLISCLVNKNYVIEMMPLVLPKDIIAIDVDLSGPKYSAVTTNHVNYQNVAHIKSTDNETKSIDMTTNITITNSSDSSSTVSVVEQTTISSSNDSETAVTSKYAEDTSTTTNRSVTETTSKTPSFTETTNSLITIMSSTEDPQSQTITMQNSSGSMSTASSSTMNTSSKLESLPTSTETPLTTQIVEVTTSELEITEATTVMKTNEQTTYNRTVTDSSLSSSVTPTFTSETSTGNQAQTWDTSVTQSVKNISVLSSSPQTATLEPSQSTTETDSFSASSSSSIELTETSAAGDIVSSSLSTTERDETTTSISGTTSDTLTSSVDSSVILSSTESYTVINLTSIEPTSQAGLTTITKMKISGTPEISTETSPLEDISTFSETSEISSHPQQSTSTVQTTFSSPDISTTQGVMTSQYAFSEATDTTMSNTYPQTMLVSTQANSTESSVQTVTSSSSSSTEIVSSSGTTELFNTTTMVETETPTTETVTSLPSNNTQTTSGETFITKTTNDTSVSTSTELTFSQTTTEIQINNETSTHIVTQQTSSQTRSEIPDTSTEVSTTHSDFETQSTESSTYRPSNDTTITQSSALTTTQTANQTSAETQTTDQTSLETQTAVQTSTLIQRTDQASTVTQTTGQASAVVQTTDHTSHSTQTTGQTSTEVQTANQTSPTTQTTGQTSTEIQTANHTSPTTQTTGQTSTEIQTPSQTSPTTQTTGQTTTEIQTTSQTSPTTQTSTLTQTTRLKTTETPETKSSVVVTTTVSSTTKTTETTSQITVTNITIGSSTINTSIFATGGVSSVTSTPNNAVAIILPSVVVFVICLAAALFGFIILRKKRKKRKYHDGEMARDTVLNDIMMLNKEEYGHNFEGESKMDTTFVSLFELDGSGELIYVNTEPGRPIPVGEIQYQIIKMQENGQFSKDYSNLPDGMILPTSDSQMEANMPKNRYTNMLAYNHSRVKLKLIPGNRSDYINANYIDGFKKKRAYIATQGPLKSTVADFWVMVWQENTTKIVMVTNLKEKNRIKCFKYWPVEKQTITCYDLKITLETEQEFPVFILRKIKMTNIKTDESRIVTQFHFTAWPDHGVPDAFQLLQFYRRVTDNILEYEPHPMVVHCSAGVGRTGTFIGLDALWKEGSKTGSIDVVSFSKNMRKNRVKMIQTLDQYTFLHFVLMEAFANPDAAIPCDMITKFTGPKNLALLSRVDREFDKLNSLRPEYQMSDYKDALDPNNISKNRFEDILPVDNYRARLPSNLEETDYINAVIIPTIWSREGFLVTQYPLQSTIIDFWSLVYNYDCCTVVLLDSSQAYEQSFCPAPEETLEWGCLNLQTTAFSQPQDCITETTLKLVNVETESEMEVKLFTGYGWNNTSDLPSSPKLLHCLHYELQKRQTNIDGHKPIIVVCRDGSQQSGLFCAVCNVLDSVDWYNEVDVYHTVRQLQIRRPEIIKSKAQYQYCYDVAFKYLDTSDIYENQSIENTENEEEDTEYANVGGVNAKTFQDDNTYQNFTSIMQTTI